MLGPNFAELHISSRSDITPAKRIVITGTTGAMRAFTVMLGLTAAIFASSLSVHAQAPEAQVPQSCDIRCLEEQVTRLEGDVGKLTTQINSMKTLVDSSIKSGQAVRMEMPNGCLTYISPSGDVGGFVSWNKNCNLGTVWRMKAADDGWTAH